MLWLRFVEVEVDHLRRVEFVSTDMRFGRTAYIGFAPHINSTGQFAVWILNFVRSQKMATIGAIDDQIIICWMHLVASRMKHQ